MARLSRGTVTKIVEVQPSAVDRAEARRRPLVQYVVIRETEGFRVERSPSGSKPSHWLIEPPTIIGCEPTLALVRQIVPSGYMRMARRKDDRVDVVEVWV